MNNRVAQSGRRFPGGLVIASTILALLLSACSGLPPRDDIAVSAALQNTADTRIGRGVADLEGQHPGLSGIYPLSEGKGALAARLLLADAADVSLDVQYYIWHGDAAGALLADALMRAAERGVRVRLLLDDNGIGGLDEWLAALNSHPNLEVRLINPYMNRRARWLGYITDFSRLNHRMHNKSFTADSQVTIVGGRNIGNEYFAAGQDLSFSDLDVIAIGPAVRDVSSAFDDYWNSEAAYPLSLLVKKTSKTLAQIGEAAATVHADPGGAAYIEALRSTQVVADLLLGSLPYEWSRTRLVIDDPDKLLGIDTGDKGLLLRQLEQLIGDPQREFLLVSPYFVPTAKGTQSLVAMAERGVNVMVLTNSLAATDVAAVHAGYAKRRKALLRGGVRLFELRPSAELVKGSKSAGSTGGGSDASLHAKTFAVDGKYAFVGSFNFDPRSAKLNTEMGLLAESPVLAGRLVETFRDRIPAEAYEVRLTGKGSMEWILRGPDGEQRLTREPEAGFMQRMTAGIARWLPIEWLL